jgi:tRNA (guanine26-N2/guanine27-N2)-dimethyltransferase
LRRPQPREEEQLGLWAYCHRCAEQSQQSLLRLRRWPACACGDDSAAPLAISGPLWLGPLQDPLVLQELLEESQALPQQSLAPASRRLLEGLRADDGLPVSCWPLDVLAKRLGGGPPRLDALIDGLRSEGYEAKRSGVMSAQFRCNAPFRRVVELASALNR